MGLPSVLNSLWVVLPPRIKPHLVGVQESICSPHAFTHTATEYLAKLRTGFKTHIQQAKIACRSVGSQVSLSLLLSSPQHNTASLIFPSSLQLLHPPGCGWERGEAVLRAPRALKAFCWWLPPRASSLYSCCRFSWRLWELDLGMLLSL